MAAAAGDEGRDAGKRTGRGRVLLLVLSAAAAAALVVGYIRDNALSGVVEALSGLQEELEGCGDLAAEYQALRKQQVDPGGEDRYVRTLMERVAREQGIQRALTISKTEAKRTETFVEMKYATELKDVSLRDVVMFLYRIQTSGKNLIPAEVSMRRQKESEKWTARLAVHAVSTLE